LGVLEQQPAASDDYLRTRAPTFGEALADRRASVAGLKNSAARTTLFQLSVPVALVEAFLDHNNYSK
jgi:hypothetical protein